MPFTEKRLAGPTQLTTSASAIYTVPANKTTIVKQIIATNTSASAATFTLYIGAASAGNAIFSATTVLANDSLVINTSQVLSTGEVLRALASANTTINLTISGVENDGPLTPNATYIADLAVTTAKLADNSVTTAKIAAGAVATTDIADNAVTQAKLDTAIPLSGFRNAIINGDFRINQRGLNSSGQVGGAGVAYGGYGFDRWQHFYSGGSNSYSAQTSGVGNPIVGIETTNYARLSVSGQSAVSDRASLWQQIESVKTFAGQQVTISFYAKAASGTPKVAVTTQQFFGSSGSPSSAVDTYFGQVTLSTSWARYQVTATLPSLVGKTFGTAGNDSLYVGFYISAGSNWNASTGSLGIQTATVDFWGMQVEAGPVATPFEQRPYGVELALCQRYYVRYINWGAYTAFVNGMGTSTSNCRTTFQFPVPMRTHSAQLTVDSSAMSTFRIVDGVFAINPTAISLSTSATGYTTAGVDFNTTASLVQYRPYWIDASNQTSGSAFIGFSAEL